MTETATTVGSPNTTPMSARLPTTEEKSHLKDEGQGMSHLAEREGVEKIVMNEDTHEEARNRRRRTNTSSAALEEDIKLMLVNGFLALSLTIDPREDTTPTPAIVKMKVLSALHSFPPTPMTYLIHQMRGSESASCLKAPRYHTLSILILIVMRMTYKEKMT